MKNKMPQINTKIIIVFLSIAMIIAGAFFVANDPERQFRATGALFSGEPNASGTISIETILKSPDGTVIRTYSPTQAYSGSLLDATTGESASSYTIRCSWTATGTDINWDSLVLIGKVNLLKYVGMGFYGQGREFVLSQEIGSVSKNVEQNGMHDFVVADLNAVMPDSVPDFEFIENEDGSTTRHGVSVPQKTVAAHAVIYVFTGDFRIEVYDLSGNKLESQYTMRVELRLQWSGSTLDVEWNNDGSTAAENISTSPAVPAAAEAEPGYTPKDVVVSTDMTDLESDEFITMTDPMRDVNTASIFGGGAQEDAGVILIVAGFTIMLLTIFFPSINSRMKWR